MAASGSEAAPDPRRPALSGGGSDCGGRGAATIGGGAANASASATETTAARPRPPPAEEGEEGRDRGRGGWTFHPLPSFAPSPLSSPGVSASGTGGGRTDRNEPPPSAFAPDRRLDDLRRSFDEDGFLCLSSVLGPSLIEELRRAAEDNFAECFRELHRGGRAAFPASHRRRRSTGAAADSRGSSVENEGEGGAGSDDGAPASSAEGYEYPLTQGVGGGFAEIVMRSPGRYEMPYGCDAAPFGEEVLKAAREAGLMDMVRALLAEEGGGGETDDEKKICGGGDESREEEEELFYLSNLSLVVSTPGSSDQGWHADGGHVDLRSHRPCHCLNVFVPLVDVVYDDLGPTELRPGTHVHTRNLAPMMLAARARRTLRAPATPRLRAGDALVFDYRVLHRGRANRTGGTDRPILVLTFAKSWFRDVLNFPKRSMREAAEQACVVDGGETRPADTM